MLGQTLTADVTVEQSAGVVRLTIANGALSLGGVRQRQQRERPVRARPRQPVRLARRADRAQRHRRHRRGHVRAHARHGGAVHPRRGHERLPEHRGPEVRGSFSFQRAGTVTTVTASGVEIALGDGSHNVLTLSNGSGQLTIAATGITGTISATAALNVPGATLAATLQLTIAGTSVTVRGTSVTLTVAGQSVTGNFVFSKSAAEVIVSFDHVVIGLGDGTTDFVTISQHDGQTGTLSLRATGITGSFAADVKVNLPGVSLSGSLSVAVDTAAGTLQVTATNAQLTIAGQQLGAGDPHARAHRRLRRVTVTDLTLKLGDPASPILKVTAAAHLSGGLRVTRTGVAAAFAAAAARPAPAGQDRLPGDRRLHVQLQHLGAALDGAEPAGRAVPLRRAGRRDALLRRERHELRGMTPSFTGTFRFDQSAHTRLVAGSLITSGATVAMAVGDVNHDGSLDLVLGGTTNKLLLNNGSGGFTATILGGAANGVALADVNNDGWLDLVVTTAADVKVFLNHTGSFATADATVALTGVTSVATGDVTGDGFADVIVGTSSGIKILASKLTASAWSGLDTAISVGTNNDAIAVGDVNGDKKLDLVVTTATKPTVYLNGTTWTPVLLGAADRGLQRGGPCRRQRRQAAGRDRRLHSRRRDGLQEHRQRRVRHRHVAHRDRDRTRGGRHRRRRQRGHRRCRRRRPAGVLQPRRRHVQGRRRRDAERNGVGARAGQRRHGLDLDLILGNTGRGEHAGAGAALQVSRLAFSDVSVSYARPRPAPRRRRARHQERPGRLHHREPQGVAGALSGKVRRRVRRLRRGGERLRPLQLDDAGFRRGGRPSAA